MALKRDGQNRTIKNCKNLFKHKAKTGKKSPNILKVNLILFRPKANSNPTSLQKLCKAKLGQLIVDDIR
jgi:hypothetical protein